MYQKRYKPGDKTQSKQHTKAKLTYSECILNIKKGRIFLMNQLPGHVIDEIRTNIMLKKFNKEFLKRLSNMGFDVPEEQLQDETGN